MTTKSAMSSLMYDFPRGNLNVGSPIYRKGLKYGKQPTKNTTKEQFVSSPSMVGQFGFWADTDQDTYPNAFDCYPFDASRHAIPAGVAAHQNIPSSSPSPPPSPPPATFGGIRVIGVQDPAKTFGIPQEQIKGVPAKEILEPKPTPTRRTPTQPGRPYQQPSPTQPTITEVDLSQTRPTKDTISTQPQLTPQQIQQTRTTVVSPIFFEEEKRPEGLVEEGFFPFVQRRIERGEEVIGEKADVFYEKRDIPTEIKVTKEVEEGRPTYTISGLGVGDVPPTYSDIQEDNTVFQTTRGGVLTGLIRYGTYLTPIVGPAKFGVDVAASAQRVDRGTATDADLLTLAIGGGLGIGKIISKIPVKTEKVTERQIVNKVNEVLNKKKVIDRTVDIDVTSQNLVKSGDDYFIIQQSKVTARDTGAVARVKEVIQVKKIDKDNVLVTSLGKFETTGEKGVAGVVKGESIVKTKPSTFSFRDIKETPTGFSISGEKGGFTNVFKKDVKLAKDISASELFYAKKSDIGLQRLARKERLDLGVYDPSEMTKLPDIKKDKIFRRIETVSYGETITKPAKVTTPELEIVKKDVSQALGKGKVLKIGKEGAVEDITSFVSRGISKDKPLVEIIKDPQGNIIKRKILKSKNVLQEIFGKNVPTVSRDVGVVLQEPTKITPKVKPKPKPTIKKTTPSDTFQLYGVDFETRLGVSSLQAQAQRQRQMSRIEDKPDEIMGIDISTRGGLKTGVFDITKPRDDTKIKDDITQKPREDIGIRERGEPERPGVPRVPTIPRITTPPDTPPDITREPPPEKPRVPKIPITRLKQKKAKFVTAKGYNAFAYLDTTIKGKKAKLLKLNEVPLTKQSAESMMARFVDQSSISARGKTVQVMEKTQKTVQKIQSMVNKGVQSKAKRLKQAALNTNDRYFIQNKHKFRSYRGTKKKPLPSGTWIERQRYRLDSPEEIKSIQKARSVKKFFGI